MRSPPALVHKTSRDVRDSFIEVRQFLVLGFLCLSIMGLLAAPVPTGKPSNYPAWWFSRGVIPLLNSTNTSPTWPTSYPTSDDYAVINQGQLKNMAMQAYNELYAQAPSYVWSTSYGTNLTTMISSWTPTSGDSYAAVNLGQLKTVSAAFYNVLVVMGYSTTYPWSGVNADDYSTANIGQAKNAFSFDVGLDSDTNGLPDWWETEYFGGTGATTGYTTNSSPDGNGLTLLQDYQQGNNPTNYYSQGGSNVVPVITVVSGNNQLTDVNQYTGAPLIVSVVNSVGGAPLTNAPVVFSVTSGGGAASMSFGGTTQTPVSVATDNSGHGQVYYQTGPTYNVTGTITATTGGQSVTFSETTSAGDGTFDAPSNITGRAATPTEIDLTWVNHASSATGIIVQSSTDYITWTTIGTLTDPTATSFDATGLTVGQIYYFRIFATK